MPVWRTLRTVLLTNIHYVPWFGKHFFPDCSTGILKAFTLSPSFSLSLSYLSQYRPSLPVAYAFNNWRNLLALDFPCLLVYYRGIRKEGERSSVSICQWKLSLEKCNLFPLWVHDWLQSIWKCKILYSRQCFLIRHQFSFRSSNDDTIQTEREFHRNMLPQSTFILHRQADGPWLLLRWIVPSKGNVFTIMYACTSVCTKKSDWVQRAFLWNPMDSNKMVPYSNCAVTIYSRIKNWFFLIYP